MVTEEQKAKQVSLPDIVGKGYGTFWRSKQRYRVIKGSRASKKSTTIALWIIVNMMKYPEANTIVFRKAYASIQNSCYKQLKWAVNRLGVDDFWEFKLNPLEAIYKPTGQRIYFRGLDDPLKVTSVTVDIGVLCWAWFEEAYEITNEADFDIIDESIRGVMPDGLFKSIIVSFNPWNEKHWLKRRFFDIEDPDVLAITTNYTCNEWLDDADLKVFETMRKNNPRRYQVAGLGNWGISEGVIYENWHEEYFTKNDISGLQFRFGLDFGYTNDPTALVCAAVDMKNMKLYIYDEWYETGMSNREIASMLNRKGLSKDLIICDSAEPKSVDELRALGIRRAQAALKGKDSINAGIQFIQNFEIIVHPRCPNFITEISNYCWDKDRFGHTINKPIDDFNHLQDALRYALEGMRKGNTWMY